MSTNVAINNDTTYKIGGFLVNREIVRYIHEASEQTGISFDYMLAKAGHESRFEVNASAQSSSAEGLYQFTTDTWLQLMKLHGPKYGYSKLSNQIYRDGRGRYRVKNEQDKEEILSLRRSPRISALIAAEFAKSNKKILTDQIGPNVSSADLYLAHFMGPNGAVILLRADKFTPNKKAADLFPEAASANSPIFYDEHHRMRTVHQVREYIANLFQDKIDRFSILPKSLLIWLDETSEKKQNRKTNVVVSAPIMRIEGQDTNPAPLPKVVESLSSATIIPGEGVNLDDETVLSKLHFNTLKLSSKSEDNPEFLSADFIPFYKKEYNVAGISSIENEMKTPPKTEYTDEAISFFEMDDYLISSPLPVLLSVNTNSKSQ
ncbi:MAG: hypothetical protein MJ247_06775 [Alphaproteobacteria bacterium]|nr:hypothetical protein [Alphaproteobacteria bacterium]